VTLATSGNRSDVMNDLARSESGRLLRQELDRRWPGRTDHLSAIIRYALIPAGKLLRPIMTLHAAEAVGGDPARVLPAALGMEYLHVATLVHDDIIDGDATRRGRSAVPAAYGLANAILAGDHLIFSAFESIVECSRAGVPADRVVTATDVLAGAGADLCRGEALEAQLVGDPDTSVAQYLEMIRLKTGALLRAVCHIGAVLGGAGPALAEQLARYGEHVGMAFQIRDDLLPYSLPGRATGKPATSDLTNGRPTLPVMLAYQTGTDAQRQDLASALNRGCSDATDLQRVREVLAETGALDGAFRQAAAYGERARHELASLVPSPGVAVLAVIARWATAREP